MYKNSTEIVMEHLIENNITIATAESCTAGMVASAIGNVPGVSSVFNEGFITYSNEAKEKYLGVPHELLEKHGAVSHEVCAAMAEGVCKKTGADIGIATTGIAGPTGGTDEKPVGLVYMGICYNGKTKIFKYIFTGSRRSVRYQTMKFAFHELRKIFDLPLTNKEI